MWRVQETAEIIISVEFEFFDLVFNSIKVSLEIREYVLKSEDTLQQYTSTQLLNFRWLYSV